MNGHDSENQSASSNPRALFDRAVDGIDPATGNRLRLMRRDALSTAPRAAPRSTWAWGTGLVAVLGIATLVWMPSGDRPTTPVVAARALPPEGSEEPEALAADEDQDLYVWLADAPVASDPKPENPL